MIKIVVTAFDGALASAITGLVDLFSMAGVSWNRIQKQAVQRLFEVKIASPMGQPVQCINGLQIAAHFAYSDIRDADIIIVPTIAAPILTVLEQQADLIELLKYANQQHWTIAGNCTGNFFLAEAGILNYKLATTHWGFQDFFSQRYPLVRLNAEQLITRDEHIYCAGGGIAWFDLGLHLIERFYGFELAIQTAKSFVIDYRRDSQLSYSLMRLAKPHQDALVENIQNWLEKNFQQSFSIAELALRFNVTTRTLIRHFKAALEITPNHYIQALRIEAAQKRLEETQQTLEVIMQEVGYADSSSFRRLFRKNTGLTPLEYRRRFSRRF